MPLPSTLRSCQKDLFTPKEELLLKYDKITAERIVRIRDLYQFMLANPQMKDRDVVEHSMTCYQSSQSGAYSDLAVVKALLPMLSQASRDFHRWRANEMLLETYRIAKLRKDTKTMERAASSYAKYNRVDLEDEQQMPYDEIVVQPFTATDDPEVLGIKRIPDIQSKIKKMIEHYKAETLDIEDVEFEEADLEENELFGDGKSTDNSIR